MGGNAGQTIRCQENLHIKSFAGYLWAGHEERHAGDEPKLEMNRRSELVEFDTNGQKFTEMHRGSHLELATGKIKRDEDHRFLIFCKIVNMF